MWVSFLPWNNNVLNLGHLFVYDMLLRQIGVLKAWKEYLYFFFTCYAILFISLKFQRVMYITHLNSKHFAWSYWARISFGETLTECLRSSVRTGENYPLEALLSFLLARKKLFPEQPNLVIGLGKRKGKGDKYDTVLYTDGKQFSRWRFKAVFLENTPLEQVM